MRYEMRWLAGGLAAACLCAGGAGCITRMGAGPSGERPAFTMGPAVSQTADGVRIAFTVSRATDVEVAVLDENGTIVRHLAAGVLGWKAPAPFKSDSLVQELVWDGCDDQGRRVARRTGRVRVALGLSGKFDRVITWEPPSALSRGILGMVNDDSGRTYFLQGACFTAVCGDPEIVVFSRGGEYIRTLTPPPATGVACMPGTRVEDPGLAGERLPKSPYANFVPGLQQLRRQTMLLRNNRLLIVPFAPVPRQEGEAKARRRILSLALDGMLDNAPRGRWAGPALPGFTTRSPAIYLAADAKGDTLYVAGLQHDKQGLYHAVLRATWTDDEFVPFLGKAFEKGKDDAHLEDPRGLTLDREGRLLVCDYSNDRIQVLASDGRLVKSLAVKGPDQVIVHPRTGAVYVLSVRDKAKDHYDQTVADWDAYFDKAVVKYAGVDDWREVASLELPKRKRHMHDPGPILALDSSGNEPVIWASCVGRQQPTDYLWRIEDRGAALVQTDHRVPRYRLQYGRAPGALVCDRARDELFFGGAAVSKIICRFDGASGQLVQLNKIADEIVGQAQLATDHPCVTALALDRQGLLYTRLSGDTVRRYDRDQRRVPFAIGTELAIVQPSHGGHPGGLAVAPNGDIYLTELARGSSPRGTNEYNVLNVYAADGTLKQAAAIPWLTTAVLGPKIDREGSLYFTDAVVPSAEAAGKTKDFWLKNFRGSLLKFRPTGAREVFTDVGEGLATCILREKEGSYPPAKIAGLRWRYYGVSPVPFGHCICAAARFDLDGWDRALVPDSENFCLKILDSAGNFIVALGGYGNVDSAGPNSAVKVPGIPLRDLNGIAASDRAIYVYDATNRRIVRIALEYAAAVTVSAP